VQAVDPKCEKKMKMDENKNTPKHTRLSSGKGHKNALAFWVAVLAACISGCTQWPTVAV